MIRVCVPAPNHSAYDEMLACPPAGIAYTQPPAQPDGRRSAAHRLRSTLISVAQSNARAMRAYQNWKTRALNARIDAMGQSDLALCCGHVCEGRPWVGDFENVNVLSLYAPGILRDAGYRAFLADALLSDHCRAIRVWSEMAANSFRAVFHEEAIRNKIRIAYPAMSMPVWNGGVARSEPRPPLIVFAGRSYWIKGGQIFLDAVALLRPRHDFEVAFICDIPDAERGYYAQRVGDRVSFYQPVFDRKTLLERFFRRACMVVMLGMADSYGMVLLEAAACGLPVVAFDLRSGLTDLLRKTRNAIQVPPPYHLFDGDGVHRCRAGEIVSALRRKRHPAESETVAEAIGSLLRDPGRARSLGEQGRAAVAGELGMQHMNTRMQEMFREAA